MLLGKVGPVSIFHNPTEKIERFTGVMAQQQVDRATVKPNYIWPEVMGEGGLPTKMNIGLGEQIDIKA